MHAHASAIPGGADFPCIRGSPPPEDRKTSGKQKFRNKIFPDNGGNKDSERCIGDSARTG